jgi:hypothetical protein
MKQVPYDEIIKPIAVIRAATSIALSNMDEKFITEIEETRPFLEMIWEQTEKLKQTLTQYK